MTPERWHQITKIFHAALSRHEADRSAFLTSTCGDDAGLRRDVESMIAAHREAGQFGDTPVFAPPAPSLEVGSSVGPYRIERWLGAGGMGQVYRARDTRLGRTVALKILAPELAHDPEFRSRFEREARTISQLDHHHICALYDVGNEDGTAYLVMQHLEGETLAQRLERGAMPIPAALAAAAQVADALDGAHTAGVIHRDLKPANIFLTKSGVKLLDFGLAKSTSSLGVNAASKVREKTGITTPGMVLGTVPYMAPEQLEGKETDGRGDLFALGAVIYEMVTGRKAFDGEHQANVISSIMSTNPPPMSTLRADVPAELDRVVGACLAKDPEARWQSARDVKRALGWILEPATGSGAVVAVPTGARRRSMLALAGVALLVGAAIASFAAWWSTASEEVPEAHAFRFEVVPPEGAAFAVSSAFMAVSPDGRSLAWHGPNAQGKTVIWVRAFDSAEARMLEGTEGVQPFWSPDSRYLAFSADGKLKKIGVAGGLAQTLADTSANQSGTWSRDDVIVVRLGSGALYRVSAAGGPTAPVTLLDTSRAETGHTWPQFLPDGRHFLYLATSKDPEYDGIVYVGSLDSNDRVALLKADSHAVFVPQGYLLFMQSNTLVAQPFDISSLRTTGQPIPIAEQVEIRADSRRGAFSVSQNGVLAYRPVGETRLTWFDRSGRQLEAVGPPGRYRNPALSPDEQRVAVARIDPETGTPDIWLIELARGVMSRFTSHPSLDDSPLWSRDGSRIGFKSARDGRQGFYQKAAIGHGEEELMLTTGGGSIIPMDWSGDGVLVYGKEDGTARFSQDLWRSPLSGDRKPTPFLRTTFNETQAQLSPDGHWIAYVSNDSGRNEILISRFPSGEGKWPISTNGGIEPRWRGDGKEVFFVALDQSLMAVAVTTGAAVQAGVPERLFETGMRGTLSSIDNRNQYVATSNGQRFLLDHLPRGRAPSSSITVIVDWMAALRK